MIYLYIIIFFLLFVVFNKFNENFTQSEIAYNEYILSDGKDKYYLVPLSLLDNNIKLYLLDNNLISSKYNIIDRLRSGIIDDIKMYREPLNDILYAININDKGLFVSNNKNLLFNSNNKLFIYDNKDYNLIENSDIYILDSNISISNYTYPFNKNNKLLENRLGINNLQNYNFELTEINVNNNKLYEVKLTNGITNIKIIKN